MSASRRGGRVSSAKMHSKNTTTNFSAPINNPDSSEEEGAVLPPAPSSPTSEALSIEIEGILPFEGASPLNNNSASNRVDWDLRPCTREAFLSHSFPKEEKYELIDGLLCAQPSMVDDQHQRIIKFLILHILNGFVNELHEFDCYDGTTVEPDSSSGSSSGSLTDSSPGRVKKPSFFVPDLIIAEQIPGKIDIGKLYFSKNGLRIAAGVEVTSEGRSREKDLGLKKKYYAKRGIAEYMIIDRDKVSKNKKGPHDPDQKVIVYTLNDKRQYEGREYRGTEEVRSRFFDGITAEEMLSPSCPSEEQRKKMRTLKKDQAEIIRRKDEETRRKDEELRLEKQERKKEEEMRRKAEEKHRKAEEKNRKAEERHRKAEEKNRKAEERHREAEERHREAEERHREAEERHRKAEEELQREKKEKEEMRREMERLRGKGRKQSDKEVKKGKEKRHKPEDSGGTARRGSAAGEHSKKGNRS